MRKQKGFFNEDIVVLMVCIIVPLMISLATMLREDERKAKQLSIATAKSVKTIDALSQSKKEIVIKNIDSWNY